MNYGSYDGIERPWNTAGGRLLARNKGAYVIGAVIRMGALINKSTFELYLIYYIFKFLFVTLSYRCVTFPLFLLRIEFATLRL